MSRDKIHIFAYATSEKGVRTLRRIMDTMFAVLDKMFKQRAHINHQPPGDNPDYCTTEITLDIRDERE